MTEHDAKIQLARDSILDELLRRRITCLWLTNPSIAVKQSHVDEIRK